ncbi:uncharacterized protein LOC121388278 [Gigantopelta aegis]|uniref:uncharacterized protein LOC121388278 n=1 Tax=Gigantopelta aegis TaxID=1735272 RepID=UPI001B88ABDF|nr:uncharacterized protein LOC121388278 [Gigantopelta aegis]
MDYDYFGPECNGGLYDEHELEITTAIQTYVYPFILLLGTVGNVASLWPLYQLSVDVWSTCLYLVVLCTVDLLVLYVKCGNTWFERVTGNNLNLKLVIMSEAVCKVYLFAFQFIVHFGAWVVVAAAIETLVLARFPHLAYRMCTTERAKAVMLFVTVLLVCLNMHYFWTYGLLRYAISPTEVFYVCTYIEDFSEFFRDQIWPFLNLSVGDIVPMLVVAVCFFCSITTYFRSKKAFSVTKPMLEKYFLDLKTLQELKVTMTVICLNFIIIATLNILLQIVEYLINNQVIKIPCLMQWKVDGVMTLIRTVWETYFFLFLAAKCLIYLCTCTRFRKELWQSTKNILMFKSCRRRDKVVNTNTNNSDTCTGSPSKPITSVSNISGTQDKHNEESKSTDV